MMASSNLHGQPPSSFTSYLMYSEGLSSQEVEGNLAIHIKGLKNILILQSNSSTSRKQMEEIRNGTKGSLCNS